VKEFCYLDSLIRDNKSTKERRRQITLAKQAFEKMDTFYLKTFKYKFKKEIHKSIHLEYIIIWM
jgi:hypothetical protein